LPLTCLSSSGDTGEPIFYFLAGRFCALAASGTLAKRPLSRSD
jgi:hypothetical protein